jgi:hypothetical protein
MFTKKNLQVTIFFGTMIALLTLEYFNVYMYQY